MSTTKPKHTPGTYGGLTIDGWREHFRALANEGVRGFTPRDCEAVADMLQALSAERISDAQAILEAKADAAAAAYAGYAAADADAARAEMQKQCADIVRRRYPTAPKLPKAKDTNR